MRRPGLLCLSDQPVINGSGRGKGCADCRSLQTFDRNRGTLAGSTGLVFGFLGWRYAFKSALFGQELPGDAGHAPSGGEDRCIGFFAQSAFAFVVVSEVGRAPNGHPSGFDKRPAQPFVAATHQSPLIGLATAARSRGAKPGVAAELLRVGKPFDGIDFAHHHGGEDGAHAWNALHEGEFVRVFVHGFESGFVFSDAGLEIPQHFELLLEQESGGRRKIELVEKAQATLAEDVAALRELQVVLGAEEAMDAVAHAGALPNEEGALAQDFLALPGSLGGNMDLTDRSGTQESGKDMGIDFIVFDLGLGDDAGLEGIGQNDVPLGEMGFEELIKPRPVHSGLKNHAAAWMSLDQVNEELWCDVVDTPLLKDAVCGIDRAKNTVSLMEIDSDKDWTVVGCGWFGHKATHPTTSISSASRVQSARRTKQDQAFMSADPSDSRL